MPYFQRTKKLSNILFGMFGVFLLISIIGFFRSKYYEILIYNFTNDIRGSIFTVICFVFSLLLLILAIALRCIAKDAEEDLAMMWEQIMNLEDKNNKVSTKSSS
ncbi:MAG TPA: hypothetical protein VIK77_10195 [Tissierellaceae bacterium]